MRQKDIFQKENAGGGFQGCHAAQIVTIVLSIFSLLAGIEIIVRFGEITAWIAIAGVSGKISLKKTQKILGLVERSIVNEWSIFECMGCNKEVSLRMVSDIFYFIGCKLREIS